MTIRTGINPEAILWKYTEQRQRRMYNYETNQHEYTEVTDYYVIRLHTRRARSQGHTVDRSVFPFFESIRIKLVERRVWRNHGEEIWYTAVGTRSDRIATKEQWDALEVDEAAQRWYSRMRNNSMTPLLDRRDSDFSDSILEELREVAQDDESEVESWPPEPNIREHSMRLESYYYSPIRW